MLQSRSVTEGTCSEGVSGGRSASLRGGSARGSKEYADLALVQWPAGRQLPDVPLRQVGKKEPVFPRLARPATLDRLLQDLHSKDAKVGWGAAEEVAKLGPAAIPDLVRLMDIGPSPASARAAAALGHMGKSAEPAMPDLRRTMLRGGSTEDEGLLSRKATEAVEEIEQATKEAP